MDQEIQKIKEQIMFETKNQVLGEMRKYFDKSLDRIIGDIQDKQIMENKYLTDKVTKLQKNLHDHDSTIFSNQQQIRELTNRYDALVKKI